MDRPDHGQIMGLGGGNINVLPTPSMFLQALQEPGCRTARREEKVCSMFHKAMASLADFAPSEDCISFVPNGSGQCMLMAMVAWKQQNKKLVLILEPAWEGFKGLTGIAELQYGVVRFPPHLKPSAALISEVLRRQKVDILILNNYSTPAGHSWTREELVELGRVLAQFPDVAIIEDCVFWASVHSPEKFTTLSAAAPSLWQSGRIIGVASLTKAWCLENGPGIIWAKPRFLQKIRQVQGETELQATAVQLATLEAAFSTEGLMVPEKVRKVLRWNLKALHDAVQGTKLSLATIPRGGTNALVLVASNNGVTLASWEELKMRALTKYNLMLEDAIGFGCEVPAFRINLGSQRKGDFAIAMQRLTKFAHSL